jgi:hypothetical protein
VSAAKATTIDPARVDNAKRLITSVLQGKRAADDDSAVQQDDLLLFAVRTVEAAEPAWLETQLKNKAFSTELRTTVGIELQGPLRKPILTALGVPAFVIGA